MFKQVHAEVLERRSWPFQVNDTHTLVKHRKNCSHKVISIVHALDLLPLCLLTLDRVKRLALLSCYVFVFDTRLNALDLNVTLLVRVLVLFDEIFGLKDCSVRVHLNDVHVHIFALRDLLASDYVAHINYTIFTIICVIIEEDVLCIVIGLINKEQLGAAILIVAGFPCSEVMLACYSAELLKSFQVLLELLQVVPDNPSIFVFIDHVDMAVVSCVTDILMSASNLDVFADSLSSSVIGNVL